MPVPVFESIATALKIRLESIDTANGYLLTVDGVTRPIRLNDFEPVSYHILLTQGDLSPNDALTCIGNPIGKAWNLPFTINGELRPSEEDIVSLDELRNTFAAEVIKAITAPGNWHQFGGFAINSEFLEIKNYTESDGGVAGFRMGLMVMTRVSETNPYEVRV